MDSGDVVCETSGSHNVRKGEDLELGLFQLIVSHGTIAGHEVDRPGNYLADSAAAANGLVVHLNVRVQLVVFAEPLRIHGIRESGPSSVQRSLRRQWQGCQSAQ